MKKNIQQLLKQSNLDEQLTFKTTQGCFSNKPTLANMGLVASQNRIFAKPTEIAHNRYTLIPY